MSIITFPPPPACYGLTVEYIYPVYSQLFGPVACHTQSSIKILRLPFFKKAGERYKQGYSI